MEHLAIRMCSMMCWYHVVRLKLAAVGSWLPDAVTSEDRSNCMSYVGILYVLKFSRDETFAVFVVRNIICEQFNLRIF